MTTVITTLKNVTLTSTTAPRVSYDPMILPGVLLRHDYRNPRTISQTAELTGGLPVSDLAVYGAQRAGSLVTKTTGAVTRDAGGLRFSQTDGYATKQYVNAGANPITNVAHDLLVIAWVKRGPTNYGGFGGVGTAFNDNTKDNVWQGILTDQSSFVQVFGQDHTGRQVGLGAAVVSQTIWTQVAFSVQFTAAGAVLQGYQNGSLQTNTTVGAMTALSVSGLPLTVGAAGGGNQSDGAVLVMHVEDLTVSGQAPLARVQRDYALVRATL